MFGVVNVSDLGWGRESWFFCYRLLLVLLFLFEVVSSLYACLRKVASFYCDTPWPSINQFKRLTDIKQLLNIFCVVNIHTINQRTNGPVNAHLILRLKSSKTKFRQNLTLQLSMSRSDPEVIKLFYAQLS